MPSLCACTLLSVGSFSNVDTQTIAQAHHHHHHHLSLSFIQPLNPMSAKDQAVSQVQPQGGNQATFPFLLQASAIHFSLRVVADVPVPFIICACSLLFAKKLLYFYAYM